MISLGRLLEKGIPSIFGGASAPTAPVSAANFGLGSSIPTPAALAVSSAAPGSAPTYTPGAPAFNRATPGAASMYAPKGSPASPAASGAPLPLTGWSTYLGATQASPIAANDLDPQASQAFLQAVRQYDPNAQWVGTTTGDGNQAYYLQYDNNRLPTNVTGAHGLTNIARGTPGSGERLLNPNAVAQDPTYGPVTNWRNLAERGPSLVDVIGPMLVSGLMGVGAAGGLSGLFSGAASANPIGYGVGNALVNGARAIGNGNPLGAALSALPFAGSLAGIPSFLTSGALTLGRLAGVGQQHNAPPGG